MFPLNSLRRCPVFVRISPSLAGGLALALLLPVLGCRDEPTAPSDPDPAVATSAPLMATSAPLEFREVSGGNEHTCGITRDNRAFCWGRNWAGQVGDGTTQNQRTRPVAVAGDHRFLHVSAGWDHTCGVTGDLRLYCWGSGGNLGDGTTNPSSTPVLAAGDRLYFQVEAGRGHTCALSTPDRLAYCWGSNNFGQLGNGTTTGSTIPVAVAGGRQFRNIAAGSAHTCGVTMDYAVFCWGSDNHVQIGDGSTRQNRSVPTRVASDRQFKKIAAFSDFTCALTRGDKAYCWGEGGAIGDGKTSARSQPTAVARGINFVNITTGFAHACGQTSANIIYCWGSNVWGQFGNGTTQPSTRPTLAAKGRQFSLVSGGGLHTCGVTPGSVAYCWGYGSSGQLGDGRSGTGVKSTTPVAVLGP